MVPWKRIGKGDAADSEVYVFIFSVVDFNFSCEPSYQGCFVKWRRSCTYHDSEVASLWIIFLNQYELRKL